MVLCALNDDTHYVPPQHWCFKHQRMALTLSPPSPRSTTRVDVLRVSEDIYSTDDMNSVILTSFKSTAPTSPPPPRPLNIHFVGDSDTAGFGIHSHPYDPACLNPYNLWSKVGDASLSWASQLADLLDADRTITAVSGVGIESAYGCKPFAEYADNALPFLYDDSSKWDYASTPSPDLVLVLLGPNDCGKSNGNKCPGTLTVLIKLSLLLSLSFLFLSLILSSPPFAPFPSSR